MQVTRENAECNNNNNKRRWVVYKDQRLSESWPKRRRKEGRKEEEWRMTTNERSSENLGSLWMSDTCLFPHCQITGTSSSFRILYPYRISVSYVGIVCPTWKENLKLGFHQKLCFSSQNLVPFLHVSVSYTRMVFPYRTSLSLSYDVPPDRVPEVLFHLMRELWKMSALAGVAVLCGQWSQLWTKPGPVPCLCFDETCKFELHC